VYPLDYARTRLASDVGSGKRDFNGLADCLKKTASGPKGVLGLYNGFGVSVTGIIPYRGVYFGLYDSAREKNPYKNNKGLMGVASKFAIAQTVAIAAGYASYPFDTVRRRLQMQSEKPKAEWLYATTMDCFRKIAKEEGTGAFFKGAGANALRTVGSALVLVMYDQFKVGAFWPCCCCCRCCRVSEQPRAPAQTRCAVERGGGRCLMALRARA
jgi:solute carrier family 25 (mitochondrial adenine nucleotide translocator), member 4/5/6/31